MRLSDMIRSYTQILDPVRLRSSTASDASKNISRSVQASLMEGVPPGKIKLSDEGRLRASLDDVREAARGLKKTIEAPVKASVKGDAITATGQALQNQPEQINLAVSTVASPQVSQSPSFSTESNQRFGAGTIRISVGRVTGEGQFQSNGTPASVSVTEPDSSLGGIARAINQANLGVRAEVLQSDDGTAQLQLSGQATGENAAIRVEAESSTGNAEFESLSLDPSRAADQQRLISRAADAALSLDSQNIQQQENVIRSLRPGLAVEVRQPGEAQVNLTRDVESVLKASRQLADSLNGFKTKTIENQSPFADRSSLNRIDQALNAALSSVTNTTGLGRNAQGVYQVDEATFRSQYAKNPQSVETMLKTAVDAVSNIVDRAVGFNGSLNEFSLGSRYDQVLSTGGSSSGALRTTVSIASAQNLPTLLGYTPSARSLYGIAQYLSVAKSG